MSLSAPLQTASESGRLDVSRTLRPAVRSIGLARVLRGAIAGLILGAVAGTCILLASHVLSFSFARPLAFGSLVAGLVVGCAWGVARWPHETEAARAVDLHFGLDDRLTTALELRDVRSPVAEAQGRDAAKHISGLSLRGSRGRLLERREGAACLVAVLLFTGGLALGPNARAAHHPVAAQRAVNTQKIRHASVKRLAQLQAQLRLGLQHGEQNTAAVRKLDRALSKLRRQLAHASNPRSALRAVSATQQQLRHLAASLHPVNSHAVAQLNGSLAHYLSRRPGSGKNGASARSAAATAQALQRLARSLSHLTPGRRAALARALGRAANSTSSNRLRSLLRQAAFALANNQPRTAQSALQRAARSLSRSAAAEAAQSQTRKAASGLGSLKNVISRSGSPLPSGQQGRSSRGSQSVSGTQSGTQSGKNGRSQGSTPAQGKGPGKGQGQGRQGSKGQGQGARLGSGTRPGAGTRSGAGNRPGAGKGRGQGRGFAGGQRTTSRTGTGGSGSHGQGGKGGSAASRRGRTVTVYDPGKQGTGKEIIRNGPNGAPQTGALVPYQQVLGQYSRQAHQALDRGSLPPSIQSYVHRYFSTISH